MPSLACESASVALSVVSDLPFRHPDKKNVDNSFAIVVVEAIPYKKWKTMS